MMSESAAFARYIVRVFCAGGAEPSLRRRVGGSDNKCGWCFISYGLSSSESVPAAHSFRRPRLATGRAAVLGVTNGHSQRMFC